MSDDALGEALEEAEHECYFREVEITEAEEDDVLEVGMKVLVPCSCGATPLDQMEWHDTNTKQMNDAILQMEPFRFLYHWAPRIRRKQIIRYGLRPNMRATVHTDGFRASVICLADSPGWAWALSGNQRHSISGKWDLWMTSLDRLTDPQVLPSNDRPSAIHEVRTESRIYKRDLWLVGTREKP